jgi:Holliday junction resolvase RusA-like endonuclease
MIHLQLPLAIATGKTERAKKYRINLNQYRNRHFLINNSIKHAFHRMVKEKISEIKIEWPVIIIYQLFVWTKRRIDVNNVLSIVDKFFSDALVESWILPDDCSENIIATFNTFGWYEKDNERVEVYIIPFNQWQLKNLLTTFIQ